MKLIPEELHLACLDALENGDTVAEILVRHPDFADELRPFLATAVHLTQLPVQPTLAARQASQQQFLRQATDIRAASQFRQSRRRWYQLLAPVVSLVFLLIVGGSLVVASRSAQPGDSLFGVRQWVEAIRFTPTAEPEPSPQPTQTALPQETEAGAENTAVPTVTTLVKKYPTTTSTPIRPVVTETAVPAPTATATTELATPAATAAADDDGSSGNNNSINDKGGEDNGDNGTGGDDAGSDDAGNDNGDSDGNSNSNNNNNTDGNNDSNSNDSNSNNNDDDDGNDNDDGGNSGPGNNNNDNDDDNNSNDD